MKFISKSSNLLIVLRAGLSPQPLTGTPARPTVSVRFKDGVAEVQQQELIDMMLAHPGFNSDFISAENVPTDPYAAIRRSSEPAHTLTEMKYGTPVARKVVGGDSAFSTLPIEMQKTIQSMAGEMAKAMLPDLLKALVTANQEGKVSGLTKAGKPKGRPGRKPKVKVAIAPEPIAENSSTQA